MSKRTFIQLTKNYGQWYIILTNLLFLHVAIVEVKSDSRSLILTITDPRGKKIETMRDQETMRHHFAAFYSGNYQICI